MKTHKNSRKTAGLFFVAVLVTLATAYLGFYFSRPVVFDQPFDAIKWQAAAGDRSSTERLAMADDLLQNHLLRLPGMTEESVLELLGPPEPQNYFGSADLMYRLGTGRNWMPGPTYLGIAFDETGHVAKATRLQD